MHFLLAYHFDIPEDQCKPLIEKVNNILEKYNSIEIFAKVKLIRIETQNEWDELRKSMREIASSCGCDLKYIITTPNIGGSYAGWLPRNLWPQIIELTKETYEE